MSPVLSAVIGSLSGSAAIGTAVLLVLQRWLEAKVTEPIRAEFAERLAAQRREFEREMAEKQGEIQRHNSEELKRFDRLLEHESKDEETAHTIEQLEYPILHEADRVIRRISEVMNGEFRGMYSRPWASKDLSLNDLDGNKKVTAVYRLMRLFGFYALYLQRSAGLPPHVLRWRLRFYMENKIDPVFASGRMFPSPVMLRDMILELSESMLNKSQTWDSVTILGFTEWVEACRSESGVISLVAERLAALFDKANPRLALLGIYLIDLRQDMLRTETHEFVRLRILDWLQNAIDPDSVSVWGLTDTGKTDLREMNILEGKIPRNFGSHLYLKSANPMGYILPRDRRAETAPIV